MPSDITTWQASDKYCSVVYGERATTSSGALLRPAGMHLPGCDSPWILALCGCCREVIGVKRDDMEAWRKRQASRQLPAEKANPEIV